MFTHTAIGGGIQVKTRWAPTKEVPHHIFTGAGTRTVMSMDSAISSTLIYVCSKGKKKEHKKCVRNKSNNKNKKERTIS